MKYLGLLLLVAVEIGELSDLEKAVTTNLGEILK